MLSFVPRFTVLGEWKHSDGLLEDAFLAVSHCSSHNHGLRNRGRSDYLSVWRSEHTRHRVHMSGLIGPGDASFSDPKP